MALNSDKFEAPKERFSSCAAEARRSVENRTKDLTREQAELRSREFQANLKKLFDSNDTQK
jgi:hypothetical protein